MTTMSNPLPGLPTEQEVRALPKYAEVLAEIRADITAFKMGWRWSNKVVDYMDIGRTDIPYQNSRHVYPKSNPEQIARDIFHDLLPSSNCLDRKLEVRTLLNAADPTGLLECQRTNLVREVMLADCLDLLLPLAHQAVERAVKAATEGEFTKHNRRVTLDALFRPMQLALWEGNTIEDIAALAAEVKEKSPASAPTFAEVWAGIETWAAERTAAQKKARGE
jgi:hypothetical protein